MAHFSDFHSHWDGILPVRRMLTLWVQGKRADANPWEKVGSGVPLNPDVINDGNAVTLFLRLCSAILNKVAGKVIAARDSTAGANEEFDKRGRHELMYVVSYVYWAALRVGILFDADKLAALQNYGLTVDDLSTFKNDPPKTAVRVIVHMCYEMKDVPPSEQPTIQKPFNKWHLCQGVKALLALLWAAYSEVDKQTALEPIARRAVHKLLSATKTAPFDDAFIARSGFHQIFSDRRLFDNATIDFLVNEENISYMQVSQPPDKIRPPLEAITDHNKKKNGKKLHVHWLALFATHHTYLSPVLTPQDDAAILDNLIQDIQDVRKSDIPQDRKNPSGGTSLNPGCLLQWIKDGSVIGVDLAGPEGYAFDSKRTEKLVARVLGELDTWLIKGPDGNPLVAADVPKYRKLLFRPHVGEGSAVMSDKITGKIGNIAIEDDNPSFLLRMIAETYDSIDNINPNEREAMRNGFGIMDVILGNKRDSFQTSMTEYSEVARKRAADNVKAFLDAIQKFDGAYLGNTTERNKKLPIRFGHATHAGGHATQMKALEVAADINLGSNLRTGAVAVPIALDQYLPDEENDNCLPWNWVLAKGLAAVHSLPDLINGKVTVVLGCDGQGVEMTSARQEYKMALDIVKDRFREDTPWKTIVRDNVVAQSFGNEAAALFTDANTTELLAATLQMMTQSTARTSATKIVDLIESVVGSSVAFSKQAGAAAGVSLELDLKPVVFPGFLHAPKVDQETIVGPNPTVALAAHLDDAYSAERLPARSPVSQPRGAQPPSADLRPFLLAEMAGRVVSVGRNFRDASTYRWVSALPSKTWNGLIQAKDEFQALGGTLAEIETTAAMLEIKASKPTLLDVPCDTVVAGDPYPRHFSRPDFKSLQEAFGQLVSSPSKSDIAEILKESGIKINRSPEWVARGGSLEVALRLQEIYESRKPDPQNEELTPEVALSYLRRLGPHLPRCPDGRGAFLIQSVRSFSNVTDRILEAAPNACKSVPVRGSRAASQHRVQLPGYAPGHFLTVDADVRVTSVKILLGGTSLKADTAFAANEGRADLIAMRYAAAAVYWNTVPNSNQGTVLPGSGLVIGHSFSRALLAELLASATSKAVKDSIILCLADGLRVDQAQLATALGNAASALKNVLSTSPKATAILIEASFADTKTGKPALVPASFGSPALKTSNSFAPNQPPGDLLDNYLKRLVSGKPADLELQAIRFRVRECDLHLRDHPTQLPLGIPTPVEIFRGERSDKAFTDLRDGGITLSLKLCSEVPMSPIREIFTHTVKGHARPVPPALLLPLGIVRPGV